MVGLPCFASGTESGGVIDIQVLVSRNAARYAIVPIVYTWVRVVEVEKSELLDIREETDQTSGAFRKPDAMQLELEERDEGCGVVSVETDAVKTQRLKGVPMSTEEGDRVAKAERIKDYHPARAIRYVRNPKRLQGADEYLVIFAGDPGELESPQRRE